MWCRIKKGNRILKQNAGASRGDLIWRTISALFLEGLGTGMNNLTQDNWIPDLDFNP
jgi:hypothetical protein